MSNVTVISFVHAVVTRRQVQSTVILVIVDISRTGKNRVVVIEPR